MSRSIQPIALLGGLLGLCAGCASGPGFAVKNDLAYSPGGGPRQSGDLYLPAGPGPHPAAVVMHGGGWTGRDRSDMAGVAELLAENGIAAFNINYRLAPEHRFPAQLEDVHAALRFLASEAADRDLDPERFITLGYSAGGHLALLAAGVEDPDGPEVRAVIAGGAPTKLLLYPKSPFITKLIGGSPEEQPEDWVEASPLHYVDAEFPPVFLYHGGLDRIVEAKNSKLMKRALESHGVPVELDLRRWFGHLILGIRQTPSVRKGIGFVRDVFEDEK